MSIQPRAPGNTIGAFLRQMEDEVGLLAEEFFAERLRPREKQFQVATSSRGTYIEVMVFIANLKNNSELEREARAWALELQHQLDDSGRPSAVYVQNYTPPARRLSP